MAIPIDDDCHSAFGCDFTEKLMTVESFAFDGKEQIAGLGLARISAYTSILQRGRTVSQFPRTGRNDKS